MHRTDPYTHPQTQMELEGRVFSLLSKTQTVSSFAAGLSWFPNYPDVTKHGSATQTGFSVITHCEFLRSGAAITHSCINKDN